MKMNRFIFASLFSVFLFSCTRETEQIAIDYGQAFFPLHVGRVWEYEVDSTVFDPSVSGTDVDSTRIWVREEIVDFFMDHVGDTIFRMERSERADTAQNWQIRKVVSLSNKERQAVRTEDNLRFVKLVFPFRDGTSWDGNRYIDTDLRIIVAGEVLEMFKDWRSKIVETGKSYFNGILHFDDVAVVSHADSENLIEYRFVQEVYARDIGLVYKEQRILDTQCQVCCNGNFAQCMALPWTAKAEKGYILRQRLIRWQ